MLSHCLNEGKLFLNFETKNKKKIVLFCSTFEELQLMYKRHLLEKKWRILRTKFIHFYCRQFKLLKTTHLRLCVHLPAPAFFKLTTVVYGYAKNCGLSVAVKDTPYPPNSCERRSHSECPTCFSEMRQPQ